MKIGIYYIATGEYKKYFPGFLESLKLFFPNDLKVVKLISDDGEKYKGYEKDNIIVDVCPRINHYPWPIVALYKMYHILENWDNTLDYVCYFNANSKVFKNIDINLFDVNKLNCTCHGWEGKNKNFKNVNISKDSCAYLEQNTYDYIQACFFFGKNSIVKKMCEDVLSMVNDDSKRFLYPQWHDESYLNKWCVINKNLVNIKQYFIAEQKTDIQTNYTFTFLIEKDFKKLI